MRLAAEIIDRHVLSGGVDVAGVWHVNGHGCLLVLTEGPRLLLSLGVSCVNYRAFRVGRWS